MAGFYAVYHGKEGLLAIANKINSLASSLEKTLIKLGFESINDHFFDTLVIKTKVKQRVSTKGLWIIKLILEELTQNQ